MKKEKTTVVALHINDRLHLSILARHLSSSPDDRNRHLKSLKSDLAKKVAHALLHPRVNSMFRAWAVHNAIGR